MNVVPALDLRDGACVQLRGGDYDREIVRLEDPRGVALTWLARGFRALHVVDLDAATGRGDNRDVVRAICAIEGLAVQVGGGVRDDEVVEELLGAGAAAVVVGTRALEDPTWLATTADANPGRVAVAVDVRGGTVTTRGWQHASGVDALAFVGTLEGLALAQLLVTAVDVEGSESGPDLELVARVRAATTHRLGIAGGVADRSHLTSLSALGVDAVVVGTALYTGALGFEGLNEEL